MKSTYQYSKIPIILLVFLGIAIGVPAGVYVTKAVGQAFELVKWQKEILLGCIAFLLLFVFLRKTISILSAHRSNKFMASQAIWLFLSCTILGIAFYLLLSSVIYLLLYFLLR